MEPADLLAAFDAQVRRAITGDGSGARVEADGGMDSGPRTAAGAGPGSPGPAWTTGLPARPSPRSALASGTRAAREILAGRPARG